MTQDATRQELLREIRDYSMLKNAWGRSGIKVIQVDEDHFIYGFFWSRSKEDRTLLGFDYKEVLERVLKIMFFNFQSLWDVLPDELRVYIHHLNFCQLKQDLKQDEKRQNVLEELHDYHNLKTYIGGYHIKTV